MSRKIKWLDELGYYEALAAKQLAEKPAGDTVVSLTRQAILRQYRLDDNG